MMQVPAPGTKPGPQTQVQPQIDPVYLAMAAAQMHAEGRWPAEAVQVAGDVVPLPVTPKGPVFRRGTSGQPIPLTPENIDRVYPQKDKG